MKRKKKLIITFFAGFCLLWFSGCTLHFKAEKMELETKPPEAKIGTVTETNRTYELASIDIIR